MTHTISCPVTDCPFDGTISDVAEHIDATSTNSHDWEQLGVRSESGFRQTKHVDRANTLMDAAQVATDSGDHETAIEKLREARSHYDKARAIDSRSEINFTERYAEITDEIDRVKTTAATEEIEGAINRAENCLDDGDHELLRGKETTAMELYDEGIRLLEEIRPTAADTSEKVYEIQELLTRGRIRKQSFDQFDTHRALLEAYRAARAAKEDGDKAFQQDNYEVALEEYRTALERYKQVEEHLTEFDFDPGGTDESVCGICSDNLAPSTETVSFGDESEQPVCPACAHFNSDSVLPTPTDVQTEKRYVEENIESIDSGNYGLVWAPTSEGRTESDPDSNPTMGGSPNDQELLVELVGTYQSVDGLPTAADLDEHTQFGYLAYQERFGSIEEALREAGFDI